VDYVFDQFFFGFSFKLDEMIEFKVLFSLDAAPRLVILVVGRSGIVYTDVQETEKDEFFLDLAIKPTKEMGPSSQLLVYYIQSTGEIIYDQKNLRLDFVSENFVSLHYCCDSKNLKYFLWF
jgi:Alpha-2-macroglobulin bait region domain